MEEVVEWPSGQVVRQAEYESPKATRARVFWLDNRFISESDEKQSSGQIKDANGQDADGFSPGSLA